MKISTRLLLAVCCIACSSAIASADILYSNIGPGFPADSAGGATTTGTFFGTTFTTTAGGTLYTLEFDAENLSSAPPITVGLYTNLSDAPGTLLESWITSVPAYPTVTATILTSVLNPTLSAATQYWLVLTETSSQVGFYLNDTGVTGGIWSGFTLDSMTQVFATDASPGIQLNSVPEPASAMLLGLGFSALLLAKRSLVRHRA
jgi:hypothetical protein